MIDSSGESSLIAFIKIHISNSDSEVHSPAGQNGIFYSSKFRQGLVNRVAASSNDAASRYDDYGAHCFLDRLAQIKM